MRNANEIGAVSSRSKLSREIGVPSTVTRKLCF
jgi:hypothetical protein